MKSSPAVYSTGGTRRAPGRARAIARRSGDRLPRADGHVVPPAREGRGTRRATVRPGPPSSEAWPPRAEAAHRPGSTWGNRSARATRPSRPPRHPIGGVAGPSSRGRHGRPTAGRQREERDERKRAVGGQPPGFERVGRRREVPRAREHVVKEEPELARQPRPPPTMYRARRCEVETAAGGADDEAGDGRSRARPVSLTGSPAAHRLGRTPTEFFNVILTMSS